MKRAIVCLASALSALMAAAIGVTSTVRTINTGDWGYVLITVWCVCVLISSLSALGRRG